MVKCECGITKQASLGLIFRNPIWCSKCPGKPKEAFDVKNKKCECSNCLNFISTFLQSFSVRIN